MLHLHLTSEWERESVFSKIEFEGLKQVASLWWIGNGRFQGVVVEEAVPPVRKLATGAQHPYQPVVAVGQNQVVQRGFDLLQDLISQRFAAIAGSIANLQDNIRDTLEI